MARKNINLGDKGKVIEIGDDITSLNFFGNTGGRGTVARDNLEFLKDIAKTGSDKGGSKKRIELTTEENGETVVADDFIALLQAASANASDPGAGIRLVNDFAIDGTFEIEIDGRKGTDTLRFSGDFAEDALEAAGLLTAPPPPPPSEDRISCSSLFPIRTGKSLSLRESSPLVLGLSQTRWTAR